MIGRVDQVESVSGFDLTVDIYTITGGYPCPIHVSAQGPRCHRSNHSMFFQRRTRHALAVSVQAVHHLRLGGMPPPWHTCSHDPQHVPACRRSEHRHSPVSNSLLWDMGYR